jgi:hypothetical protein
MRGRASCVHNWRSREWSRAGVAVDVRDRFDGRWSCGFEVAEVVNDRDRPARLDIAYAA